MTVHDPLTVDGAALGTDEVDGAVGRLIASLADAEEAGWYGGLEVVRPWSDHNPRIMGEFARPHAVRRTSPASSADCCARARR